MISTEQASEKQRFLDLLHKAHPKETICIAVVCTGNINRSPAIAGILRREMGKLFSHQVAVTEGGSVMWRYDMALVFEFMKDKLPLESDRRLFKAIAKRNEFYLQDPNPRIVAPSEIASEDFRQFFLNFNFLQCRCHIMALNNGQLKKIFYGRLQVFERYIYEIEEIFRDRHQFSPNEYIVSLLGENYQPQPITHNMLEEATAIITVDLENKIFLEEIDVAKEKVFLFTELTDGLFEGNSIPDPEKTKHDHHAYRLTTEQMFEKIEKGIQESILPMIMKGHEIK